VVAAHGICTSFVKALHRIYTLLFSRNSSISLVALTAFGLIDFGARIISLEAEDTRRGKMRYYTLGMANNTNRW
jgi:hypothetical protein